jgi:predicted acylesterase/phospholipase RssA/CRP-like cAMP-binding protein
MSSQAGSPEQDKRAARRLLRHATLLSAPAGTILAGEGTPAADVLLILSGTVESSETNAVDVRRVVAGRGNPAVFPHTWRARTDLKVARLPLAALQAEAVDQPVDRLAHATLEVLQRRELVAGAVTLFGSLGADTIADLERDSDWMALKRGDILVREGEESDRAFVLLAGRLQAVREVGGETVVVGDITVGETVAEMSLFTGERRSATVRAVRDSVLLGLSRQAVERLLAAEPAAVRHIIKVQIERVQRANRGVRLRAPLTNIAIVPLDDDVAAGEFCRQLSTALAAFGRVEHLTPDRVDADLKRPGIADSPKNDEDAPLLARWLNEVEFAARFVVHETSARHPGWLTRSVSRADVVVLLARGDRDPRLRGIEGLVAQEEGGCPAQHFLVLLHDAEALPSGTAGWLRPRTITRHFHVRLVRQAEVARVARFIAGRAVGLVLGAGGARGFAHIGLFRALQERGIPVDLVAGTSMGAAMSAQHAMGWTPQRMVETADEVWNRMRPHKEYTLPLLAVLRGRRSRQCAEMMYGDVQIEDLWVPFFCISSDITDASMFVHRAGSLLDAVSASSSPPVMSMPTSVNEHLLFDGSLFNTLPVDLARDSGCGVILASRVSVRQERQFVFEHVPTLGQVLRHKLTRRPIRYPDILSVLMRSSMIAAVGREGQESQHADFLFQPPIERYGLLEFTAVREIVDVGYTFAMARLDEWQGAGRLSLVPRDATH